MPPAALLERMIFVAGISSSGKTYMLRRLAERRPGAVVVSGSRILAELGRPIRPLTPAQARFNQWALLDELAARALLAKPEAILDGHATIETSDGPIAIPDAWYDVANFDGFILVEADPATIAERRAGRGLPWTADEAAGLQRWEREELVRQAERLGRPHLRIRSGDVEAAEGFLDRALRNRPEG